MADWYDKKTNPFLPDNFSTLPTRNALADLVSGLGPPQHSVADILRGLASPPSSPKNSLSGLLALGSQPYPGIFGSLASLPSPALPVQPYATPAPVKRKAFFSFHFDDVMRVTVVRNAWKISHPQATLMRSFYDSSLWESRQLEGDVALKRLIREGVHNTSAICVLVGSETWLRRWVKYEIARAVIDRKGLLAVHLNSIRHHRTRTPHTRGQNPLDFMAVGKVQTLGGPRYYLFEKVAKPDGVGGYRLEWHRYEDYTESVTRPIWLDDPQTGYVTPLSTNAYVYDYIADEGHKNIGSWIDRAAVRAGR